MSYLDSKTNHAAREGEIMLAGEMLEIPVGTAVPAHREAQKATAVGYHFPVSRVTGASRS